MELSLESWNDEAVHIVLASADLELVGEPKAAEEFRLDSK